MTKRKIGNAISEIIALLNEAEAHAENAAEGYDAGWYNGSVDAYENVLAILNKAMEENNE